LLDENVKDEYAFEIIDVLKNPELAEHDNVFATPTVVKVLPPPVKKIMGNLSKEKKILSGLGLHTKTPEITAFTLICLFILILYLRNILS